MASDGRRTAAEAGRGGHGGPWVCRNDAIYADHIRHNAGRETLPRWVAQASKMSDPEHTYAEVCATARLIATTRNLLPLIARLVEAFEDYADPEKEDDVDANYQRVERAYAAFNSAAAKEVK